MRYRGRPHLPGPARQFGRSQLSWAEALLFLNATAFYCAAAVPQIAEVQWQEHSVEHHHDLQVRARH